MPSCKRVLMLMAVASPLFLAACGDGWEVRPYAGFPYDSRTAGTGVEYVRASLMPPRELSVAPVAPPPQEDIEVITPQHDPVIEDAAPIFEQRQIK